MLLYKIIDKIKKRFEKRKFTRRLVNDYGFRTVIFSLFSFAVSLAYGIFNGVLAFVNVSFWHFSLAFYYVLMSFLRGNAIVGNHRGRGETDIESTVNRYKTYRKCGILMIVLHLAMSGAIGQMVFDDKGAKYVGAAVYAAAAYALYKTAMALVNFFKAGKHGDPTIAAIRNINLADALVSLLALQSALLTRFGSGGTLAKSLNTFGGILVTLSTLGLGIYMICDGTIKITRLEKQNG